MLSKVQCFALTVLVFMGFGTNAVSAQDTIAPTSDGRFYERILARHNGERARVGVPPLVWSDRLAHDAAGWAQYLAKSDKFEHAPDGNRNNLEGENLWMGTTHAFSPEEMIDGWIDERTDFIPGIFPNVTRTSNWEDVGHYTQLIWANTTQVGCALSSNQNNDYLVCRYSSPGNWMGENPLAIRRAVAVAGSEYGK